MSLALWASMGHILKGIHTAWDACARPAPRINKGLDAKSQLTRNDSDLHKEEKNTAKNPSCTTCLGISACLNGLMAVGTSHANLSKRKNN